MQSHMPEPFNLPRPLYPSMVILETPLIPMVVAPYDLVYMRLQCSLSCNLYVPGFYVHDPTMHVLFIVVSLRQIDVVNESRFAQVHDSFARQPYTLKLRAQ